jgi:hypothetical protein
MKKFILILSLSIVALTQNVFSQSESSLMNVVTSYFNLKNALTKDNGESVRVAGKQLYDAINKVPMEKLSAARYKTWMLYNEKLSYDAEHIKGTTDIDHQREHFGKLTANMYKLLKMLKINTTDIYYQFCPMANDGKGAYWLSEKSEISNPYMGKKMPSCGSTKETLKANQ